MVVVSALRPALGRAISRTAAAGGFRSGARLAPLSSFPVTLGSFQNDERRRSQLDIAQLGVLHVDRRLFHATAAKENAALYAISFSMVALGAKFGVDAYIRREQEKEVAAAAAAEESEATGAGETGKNNGETASSGNTENSFAAWISNFLGKKYYEGGFEEEMTRREAALILGIRESAPKKKVREAHRRLAMLNHPDTGGSTFVASKINEAKEMLLGAR